MAVARAGRALGRAAVASARTFITTPAQRGVEFGFEKLFYNTKTR
jgi:hypothetical protein